MIIAGGTYTYDGETHIETVLHHSYPEIVGRTVSFKIKLDSYTWTVPTSDSDVRLKEIWVKVE